MTERQLRQNLRNRYGKGRYRIVKRTCPEQVFAYFGWPLRWHCIGDLNNFLMFPESYAVGEKLNG